MSINGETVVTAKGSWISIMKLLSNKASAFQQKEAEINELIADGHDRTASLCGRRLIYYRMGDVNPSPVLK